MTKTSDENPAVPALQDRVRAILLHEWDPIGIRDVPHCRDEYDLYADEIVAMLVTGHATIAEIANRLSFIATDQMCLGIRPQSEPHGRRVAAQLIALRAAHSRDGLETDSLPER